ncbi:uncharacterized protein LOC133829534 [Humulus lupulus]|uniref:uncharacterized protein LOC133829534 n=1 Tax=Humulus lupulus TaxID=3486 RepID=UPI002B412FC1|nr:uncharacterized protein LOC133829534 [Humulus lupulus]
MAFWCANFVSPNVFECLWIGGLWFFFFNVFCWFELVMVDDNCTIPGTPLSSIKNGFHNDRVARVVAIVKSCTPNGLGGLMVTLKDPTGTIGASIHRKVLSEGEFGKNISIGTVLILQKVLFHSLFYSHN